MVSLIGVMRLSLTSLYNTYISARRIDRTITQQNTSLFAISFSGILVLLFYLVNLVFLVYFLVYRSRWIKIFKTRKVIITE